MLQISGFKKKKSPWYFQGAADTILISSKKQKQTKKNFWVKNGLKYTINAFAFIPIYSWIWLLCFFGRKDPSKAVCACILSNSEYLWNVSAINSVPLQMMEQLKEKWGVD